MVYCDEFNHSKEVNCSFMISLKSLPLIVFFHLYVFHLSSMCLIILTRTKYPNQFHNWPSTDKWMNKMSIHTMIYYPAIKRNVILICATTWWTLKTLCWNRPDTEDIIWFHLSRQIHRDRKYSRGYQGLRGSRE